MDENLDDLPDLPQLLWDLVVQIPMGRVATCGGLAVALGDRVAARWIGTETLHHDHTADCPCHRVVRVGGVLGGYVDGDFETKRQRLIDDGISIATDRVDLHQFEFTQFRTARPLVKLRDFQNSLLDRWSGESPAQPPERIGAVDVSYAGGDAVAAFAVFDTDETTNPVWSQTIRRGVRFPYISSYLAFRELPVLLELIGEASKTDYRADVVLVDGSGILHPRRMGIATMLGILAEVPTIGVTKKLLCGTVDISDIRPAEVRPVIVDGQVEGFAVGAPSGSKKPLYVSPGQRTDVAYCRHVIERLLESETASQRRLLEPIHFVDRLSREFTKKR